jgi:hypothetical protein
LCSRLQSCPAKCAVSSPKTSSITRDGAPSPPPPRSSRSRLIGERNLYNPHKASSSPQNSISLVHLVSFASLAIVLVSCVPSPLFPLPPPMRWRTSHGGVSRVFPVTLLTASPLQVIQFFFADAPFLTSTSSRLFSSIPYSPPDHLTAGVCEVSHPFLTQEPVSRPHKMSLLAEAKRVAAEFDFSDDDIRAIGAEFVAQMSELSPADNPPERKMLTMAQMRGWRRMRRP